MTLDLSKIPKLNGDLDKIKNKMLDSIGKSDNFALLDSLPIDKLLSPDQAIEYDTWKTSFDNSFRKPINDVLNKANLLNIRNIGLKLDDFNV